MLRLRANGFEDSTLRTISYSLAKLDKLCDMSKPEQVKLAIANMNVKKSYKIKIVDAYNYYCETNEIQWKKPKYRAEEVIPLIPTTANVNKIISASTEKYATIFTILAETGLEGHELATTTRQHIDAEQGIISASGCKGHDPRSFKLKPTTASMLRVYLHKHNGERPFPESRFMSQIWTRTRNKLAKKLQDPQLKQIQMRHLRNYSGAQVYHRTKDPIRVKRHLGHKSLENTMRYLRGIRLDEEEEYTCRTASNVKEATELIEAGFEYMTEIDGLKLFRKRK